MALFGSKRDDGAFGLVAGSFPDPETDIDAAADSGVAVLAGGCFWCVEAVYLELDGVNSVVSGYAGGTSDTANYHAVCSGRTGHAEVVKVEYDPAKISFGMLLKIFFSVAHDPTQLNRQGNDVGPQYRSSIFYADNEQKRVAEAYIAQVDKAKVLDDRIVTKLEKLERFFDGEDYHQNYAARNPMQPYIAYIAAPKVQKLYKLYPDKTKQ
ncbi:MAG: peptide-methionine (S)-S-oxide reductase MsrA [Minwuia sp.]|uniref:peptide-methionine (S)-S-oxide reductase MsrA n=1 Tax=Minwuia sp. TaxID=2493630 RepID=UPI003A8AAC19